MQIRSYLKIVSKFSILLVAIASLAPSISHALAAQNNSSSFFQEVCASNGTQKVVIQMTTTQGKQLPAVFDSKSATESPAKNAVLHLEHCPFCGTSSASINVALPSKAWVFMLAEQAQSIHDSYVVPHHSQHTQTAHLSRAPPTL